MLKREAIVKHIQGVTFAGKADTGHWVMMDGPARLGGSDAGARPKELVLIGLGGCTASDVANILQKKRVPFEDLEILLHADAAEDPPQVGRQLVERRAIGRGKRARFHSLHYCPLSGRPTDVV